VLNGQRNKGGGNFKFVQFRERLFVFA